SVSLGDRQCRDLFCGCSREDGLGDVLHLRHAGTLPTSNLTSHFGWGSVGVRRLDASFAWEVRLCPVPSSSPALVRRSASCPARWPVSRPWTSAVSPSRERSNEPVSVPTRSTTS